MKPFNLEKALAGAPVQLRDGRKAKLIFKVEDAYNALFDTTQNKDSFDRYNQFRALNALIGTVEIWLDGCKMIDIEIW